MPSTIAAEKAALRQAVKEAHLSAVEKKQSDLALFARFLSFLRQREPASLFLFYGVDREPETALLLERLSPHLALSLPRCLPGRRMEFRRYLGPDHLSPSRFGIPEPDLSCPLAPSPDLILVPNLCCDLRGFRLGHGGGYYDRYLAAHPCPTVALCRERFLFHRVPVETHDYRLDVILTEECTLTF